MSAATPGGGAARDPAGRQAAHGRRLAITLVVAVLLAALGAAALTARRHRRVEDERARLARAAAAGPEVLVAVVARTPGERIVTLPGDVRAFLQTTLFAKVNGYVRELRVDKGERVRRGQVLARIASPETDRQVDAARAALDIQRRTAARTRALARQAFISRQELDQANANLRAAEAELRRVSALQDYEVLRAPFDGVVTARYVDPGALLPPSQTGQPVLDLADPSRLRVLVYVGQDVAPFLRPGDRGVISIDQHPDLRVEARVSRMADALDPRSRSMLVELWVPNDGPVRLVPGVFAHVALSVKVPPRPAVPTEAIVARGEKLQVAVVRAGKLHFVDVDPGATDGRTVEIRRGLVGEELVALSPPSDLAEGAPIQAVRPRPPGRPQAGDGAPRGGEPDRRGRAPPAR